ncbi:hypothetical protein ATO6_03525 [Oceanicola sp. 22II-s10i]|nr:hypothetical protein ATO6_03525 [Oceanicola sp. 22II-s10i]
MPSEPGASDVLPGSPVPTGRGLDPRVAAFLIRNVGKGDILHAGAFSLDAIEPISAALAKDAELWIAQGDPTVHSLCGQAVTEGQIWNVSLRFAVAWSDNGRLYPPVDGASEGAGYVMTSTDGPDTITALRLDDARPLDRLVSVLSVDMPGQEAEAMRGARRTILTHRPILVLSSPGRQRWYLRHLEPLGYRLSGRLSDRLVLSTGPVVL